MTCPENNSVLSEITEILFNDGMGGLNKAVAILINEAMRVERLNREIKRRTSVVGIFPNVASSERLISAVLLEISEEWQTGGVYLNIS